MDSKVQRDLPMSLSPPFKDAYKLYEKEAKIEQLRLVVGQSPFLLLGNYAAGLTVLIGSWQTVDRPTLVGWFAALVAFSTLRALLARRFIPGQVDPEAVSRWERRVLASTLISGVLWGSAGHLLYLHGMLDHDFFLAVPIIGMGAAAVTAHSYHQFAYPLFFIPAVTPLVLNLAQETDITANIISLATPIYFLMMYLLSQRIYRASHAAVLCGFANQHLATHDYLTGIANRRALHEALEREWARGSRSGKPLSLIIADIDDFKHCNDTFGHSTGDEVLRTVASAIQHRVRKGVDTPARIGGEEFAVVLSETDLTDACQIAEDMRLRTHAATSVAATGIPATTISLGVACMTPDAGTSPNLLFERADQALYQAKLEGKDRIVADRRTEQVD